MSADPQPEPGIDCQGQDPAECPACNRQTDAWREIALVLARNAHRCDARFILERRADRVHPRRPQRGSLVKNDAYKLWGYVPIPSEWFEHCAWCDRPVDRNGPAVLMMGAVAHGRLPTDCPPAP